MPELPEIAWANPDYIQGLLDALQTTPQAAQDSFSRLLGPGTREARVERLGRLLTFLEAHRDGPEVSESVKTLLYGVC